MTTWIGTFGAMVPTVCAADLPTSTEDRMIAGGGVGSLSPTRHLLLTSHGAGGRRWAFSRPAAAGHEVADLHSLYRAQRTPQAGQALTAYRFIPCDAGWSNMFTPGASEELAGWTGSITPQGIGRLIEPAAVRRRVRTLGTLMASDLIMTAGLQLKGPTWVEEEYLVEHDTWGRVATASGTIISPRVPLLGDGPWPALGGIHVRPGSSPVTVTVQAVTASGAVVQSLPSRTIQPGATRPTREFVSGAFTSSAAVAWQIRVTAASGTYTVARPSTAQTLTKTRWVPGAGAEKVILSPLSTSPIIATPGQHLTSVSYVAIEEGA